MSLGVSFGPVLTAARLGEDWAWNALYEDLSGAVRGFLTGRGAPSPEDETSETFLHVAKDIHSFEGDENAFRSWVFSIAYRRMVDAQRKRARRPEHPTSMRDLDDEAREATPSAEQAAIRGTLTGDVERMLRTLSPHQRDVILMRVVAGLSARETAEALGRTETSVRVTQHRALQSLRKCSDLELVGARE